MPDKMINRGVFSVYATWKPWIMCVRLLQTFNQGFTIEFARNSMHGCDANEIEAALRKPESIDLPIANEVHFPPTCGPKNPVGTQEDIRIHFRNEIVG